MNEDQPKHAFVSCDGWTSRRFHLIKERRETANGEVYTAFCGFVPTLPRLAAHFDFDALFCQSCARTYNRWANGHEYAIESLTDNAYREGYADAQREIGDRE